MTEADDDTEPGDPPAWLPARLQAPAKEHADVLALVFAKFDATGVWPDPVQLQREARAAGQRLPVARIVEALPDELVRRDRSPDRAVLGLFGLASVPAARPLLEHYFAVLQLALARHDQPEEENRLTHANVEGVLGFSPTEADRLSKVLFADHPFLASGTADGAAWEYDIDERIVDYEDAQSVDDFLAILARQRVLHHAHARAYGIGPIELPPSEAAPPSPTPRSARPPSPRTRTGTSEHPALTMTLTVIGVLGTALALKQESLPVALGAGTLTLATAAIFLRWPEAQRLRALALAVGLAVAVGALTFAIAGGTDDQRDLPSTGQQLDEIVAAATKQKQYAVVRRAAVLHGAGEPSYLLVLRDEALRDRFRTDLSSPLSDELRIYDDDDGELRLRFRLQAQNPGEVIQRPEGDYPGFLFRLAALDDFDGNGKAEIVGAFERYTLATGPLPVPVLIAWDDGAGSYRMSPLTPRPPDLTPPPGVDRTALDGYLQPTMIYNQHSEDVFSGYAVDDFLFTRARKAPVFAAAYLDPSALVTGSTMYKVKTWFVDMSTERPEFIECERAHLFVSATSSVNLRDQIRARAIRRGACSEG